MPSANVCTAEKRIDVFPRAHFIPPIKANVAQVMIHEVIKLPRLKTYGNTGTNPIITNAHNVQSAIESGLFFENIELIELSLLAERYALTDIENPSPSRLAMPMMITVLLERFPPVAAATTANVVTVPSTAQ